MSNLMAKAYLKSVSESCHLKTCLMALDRIGIVAWRNNTGAMKAQNRDGSNRYVKFGEKGMPDIMGYIPKEYKGLCNENAIAFFWEVKRMGGRPTKEQKEFIDKAVLMGAYAGIGTSDDMIDKLKDWGLL